MAEVLHRQLVADEADLQTVQCTVHAADQRAELRLGQTVSVYAFVHDGRTGQLTVWHETSTGAIDWGAGSLWGFWDEESETLLVDDGGYKRQQFNTSGKLIAEFGR